MDLSKYTREDFEREMVNYQNICRSLRTQLAEARQEIEHLQAELASWYKDLDSILPLDESRGKIRISVQVAEYVNRLRAEVERRKLKYETTKPSIDGYYWLKGFLDDKNPQIVEYADGTFSDSHGYEMRWMDGWSIAGPIEPPEEK